MANKRPVERVGIILDKTLMQALQRIYQSPNVSERLSIDLSAMGVPHTVYDSNTHSHGVDLRGDEKLIVYSARDLESAVNRYAGEDMQKIFAKLEAELEAFSKEKMQEHREQARNYSSGMKPGMN